jgi:nanoRNase/pAp phosphatase (c-di-AMP/oligoRNAs hydrolase)
VKSYPKIIDRIIEIIREHKTFCIVGHVRPDGDCIGSQLGLAQWHCTMKAKKFLLE